MKSPKIAVALSTLLCLVLFMGPVPYGWAAAERSVVQLENMFVDVSEKAMPTVVHITSQRQLLKDMKDKMDEDFFKIFPFPHMDPDAFRAMAAGSGLIMDKAGYILTNNHLVENSESIKVKIGDKGRLYDGQVIGRDPATDLAVIKIEPEKPLPQATLGDSSKLKVGQWAIAIGDPFGLEKTVSVGVISGLGRAGFGGPLENVRYQDFIQTDASINPGNSGGPLLNSNGEVIGINTFIQSAGSGIGFAIPVNMAKEVYEQVLEHGEVIRGYLGVGIRDLWEGMAAALNVPDMKGALIDQVMPDTPAEKAGLTHGDVVRKIDGIEIESSKMLQQIISHKSPGDKVRVTLLRQGEQKELTVELSKFPAEIAMVREPEKKENVLGLAVGPLPEGLAQPGEKGVFITDVEPNGPAEEGELAEGDIILEVNMQEVKSVDAFWKIVDDLKPGQWVSFYIKRANQTIYRAVKIPTTQP